MRSAEMRKSATSFRKHHASIVLIALLFCVTVLAHRLNAAENVGSDTCKACHEEIYKSGFDRTPHFKTALKNGLGCESCHGPGGEHVASGGDKSKIIRFAELSKTEANQRCLSCHGEKSEQAHFANSAHSANDVGCLDCHSPHHAK